MDLTASDLIAALLVNSIGFGVFLYGKRERRAPQLLCGAALMGLPYFTGDATTTYPVAAALLVGMWCARHRGSRCIEPARAATAVARRVAPSTLAPAPAKH